MTEVLRYYSAFPTQVTDESHSRLQQYVRAEDFDRMTAERDQLQRDNVRLMDIARDLTITVHSNLGSTELDERCQADLAALENKA